MVPSCYLSWFSGSYNLSHNKSAMWGYTPFTPASHSEPKGHGHVFSIPPDPAGLSRFLPPLSAGFGSRSSRGQILQPINREGPTPSLLTPPAEMQGGFGELMSSFPSDGLVCSEAPVLSMLSAPPPHRLGRRPRTQPPARPPQCSACPLSQTEEVILMAAAGPAPVCTPPPSALGPFPFSTLGNGGGDGKRG